MAIQLSAGAVERMCGGDTKITPILQVTDIRRVSTSNNQTAAKERYRMVLSDGTYVQQGMLGTQRNDLVQSGKLQKGSVIKLLLFACNVIQNRAIIIVTDLEMISEVCDLIGQPIQFVLPGGARPVQPQSFVDQTRTVPGDPQNGNARSSGVASVANPTLAGGASLQHPNLERGPQAPSYVNAGNANTGRFASTNAPSMNPSTGFGSGNSVDSSGTTAGGLNNYRTEGSHAPSMNPRPGFGSGNSVGSATGGGLNNYRTEASHAPNTRPPQPAYGQPPPMYMNRGPTARNEAPPRIIPVAALNPYQVRWTIKARVTAKGEMRSFRNGEGKVFSFDLLDSDGGEIRATCFNAVVDQFYNQIEAGRVYLISKGILKPAKKQYNHLPNDYEISLESTSLVQPCFDDDNSIPRQQFHFRPISDVEGFENNKIVDIIGIVSSVNPTSTIMRKNSTETQKRTLQLKDQSGKSVELVLWGNFCNAEGQELQTMCDSGLFPVLVVKSARVNDFIGKAVGTISTSQLLIEPDFPEARALKEWFDREGRNTPCVSISRDGSNFSRTDVRKTISQIKDERLGTSEKPDYIAVSANIIFMKVDNFCYTACPLSVGDRKCSKKVTNNGDGKWQCDRCDQLVDECEYRYILQCQIQDHTGQTWVTAFQEWGEDIMGIPAKDLYYMKYEEQDDEKFNKIVCSVLFTKFVFKLKVKEETFSDEQRVKSTVMKAERVNFSSEAKFLLDLLPKLNLEGSNAPSNAVNNYTTGQPTNSPISYGGNTGFSGRESGLTGNQVMPNGAPQNGTPRYQVGNTSGGMYVSCSSCGGPGHSSANCPSVMSGPGQISGGYVGRTPSGPATGGTASLVTQSGSVAGGECFKCHGFGHMSRNCPGISSVPPAYGMQKQRLGGY